MRIRGKRRLFFFLSLSDGFQNLTPTQKKTPSLPLDPEKKKLTPRRRPRRGESRLPLARPDRARQVEGGAHRLRRPGRVGDRYFLGDEDLWGREEGREERR